VHFLEPLLSEIEAAIEILRRLRWAVRLAERGLSVAPGPLPGWQTRYQPTVETGRVASVLMPEEMVARLEAAELRNLCDEWEAEVREWGRGIWERRGDTLRLRGRRQRCLDAIEGLRNGPYGDPTLSEATAARIANQLDAEPGTMFKLPNGNQVMHAHCFEDPFGNPLPYDEEERLLQETEEDRVEPLEDDRALRRLVKGEHKKSRGGVRDLAPRLLRSTHSPDKSGVPSDLVENAGRAHSASNDASTASAIDGGPQDGNGKSVPVEQRTRERVRGRPRR